MLNKSKNGKFYITPELTVKFTSLKNGSPYVDSNNKAGDKGQYNIRLLLDPDKPEEQEFMNDLTALWEEEKKRVVEQLKKEHAERTAGKKIPFKEPIFGDLLKDDLDKDKNLTGKYLFTAKENCFADDLGVFPPRKALIREQGKSEYAQFVYGGSKVKVSFTFRGVYIKGARTLHPVSTLNMILITENAYKGGGFTPEDVFDDERDAGFEVDETADGNF